jgi:lipopolysaccharide transport system permease protein
MSYVNIQGRSLPFAIRYISDLLTYRHLAWNLVGSDLRSRFRRSYLGILWAIIQPLGFSLIIGYVWGTVFKMPSVWEFALYVFSGVLVWEYFATIVSTSQDALLNAEGFIKQTRIPFLIFQLRTALTSMVVLGCGSLGLFAMMAVMGKLPSFGPHLLYIPASYLVLFLFLAPLTVIMSILGTQLRDLKYITGLAVQALFFVSPVMLKPASFDSPSMVIFNYFNPMAQMLHMFRQPLFNNAGWTPEQIITVSVWGVAFWVAAFVMSISAGRRLVFAI